MAGLATRFRYSGWDGSQDIEIAADDVLRAIADDLMTYGDFRWAIRNLMSRGMPLPDGTRMQGLRDLMLKLRERKKERLERFDLGSVMKDIEEKLAEILALEEATIDEWLDRDESDFSEEVLRQIAERNQDELDRLPETRRAASGRSRSTSS